MTLVSSVNDANILMDDARVIIYNHNMFIIHTTGLNVIKLVMTVIDDSSIINK
jgi:hypothetical protein